MSGFPIITIGREYGSGGRIIGRMLAERMGINCYDKELITLAAKESGLCPEVLKSQDEVPNTSFFYSLVMDSPGFGPAISGYSNVPLNQRAFLAQFDTIQNIARKESAVFVGRCADYTLEEFPNVTKVFIHANMDDKIHTVCRLENVTKSKAADIITKTDKKRANYYNYYTNKKWGAIASYDLCINSSVVGYDGAVEVILKFTEERR